MGPVTRSRAAKLLGASAALAVLGLGTWVASRARTVARELVDPPFYKPQPLPRVEATFRDLAAGDATDPGGAWESFEAGPRRVWYLRRKCPAPAVVVLLHGFGDDRWGTSPALRLFPRLDAAIFTYRGRDEALRGGERAEPVTLGAEESREVVRVVHELESRGTPRSHILLMGRSLGASVGLLALADLEREGRGPLGGIVWEGAPASSRDFAERLVRGPRDQPWHPALAPLIGNLASCYAAHLGHYRREDTDLLARTARLRFATPGLCFIASQDRLAPPAVQRELASRFDHIRSLEVPTWHLHCSEVLGGRYAASVAEASEAWTLKPQRINNLNHPVPRRHKGP